MQANWSLILNVLLLIGVFIAIARMMKARRTNAKVAYRQPSVGAPDTTVHDKQQDDIIAVRRVIREEPIEPSNIKPASIKPASIKPASTEPKAAPVKAVDAPSSIMMFLLAKENRQLAGYELLQTVLSAGLRFGEGHLFHRHQHPNGQGPVLCSLAAATKTGVFDLQNIGAFSVRGLCIFMQASGNPVVDRERFSIMLDTAKQLSEGLDTHLLDDKRQPFSDTSLQRYYRYLNLGEECEQTALA
ncbi:cell division protein ZipA C-terminal FtsZ-binding domain-containing protein [Legionella oakridgensis]|uniref:Cell division protein ZipA n=2 Tax=Legionella oakridgensis TaxID=29423 RepID=W0B6G9_9GAMM|nr:cell division protein ZipA C-terminal FtsZ-binding domain-containing protein [Legionella oakridgensis]AHE66138.1 cell division protein [Legionella oakridgensis ATCC 33761 = DSM 21215]KTD43882.1 cell division protein ZipA [Legionella oakridgensis]STY16050.1 cell division protein ZipA [Legionella longbeachae]